VEVSEVVGQPRVLGRGRSTTKDTYGLPEAILSIQVGEHFLLVADMILDSFACVNQFSEWGKGGTLGITGLYAMACSVSALVCG